MGGKRRAEVAVEHPGWRAHAAALNACIARACRAVLDDAEIQGPLELGVRCADDAALRALNRDFRGKDKPTNVLSFPGDFSSAPGGGRYLGDIAISLDTVAREAKAQGKRWEDHLTHLVMHAALHLLGYDHEEEDAAERMEAKEINLLKAIGIGNPYERRD